MTENKGHAQFQHGARVLCRCGRDGLHIIGLGLGLARVQFIRAKGAESMTYSTLIADARAFYGALSQNNKRDWWLENKATYDSTLKAPALQLLDALSPALADLADAPVKGKLFRPHRDVRFSKDKTPYNTHLHMMWQIETEDRQNPVFFFGIGLDYITTGAGMMGFDKPVLEDWRKFADMDHKRMLGIIGDVESKGYHLREPALKRIPSTFDKDHPAGRLLRMKGLVASGELPPTTQDLPTAILSNFRDLWPVNALLVQIAEA